MRRILAVLLVLLMAFCLIACGTQKDTTLTGMVTSIDGTFLERGRLPTVGGGEMPELPEGEMDIANALSFCTVTGTKAVSYNSLRPTG